MAGLCAELLFAHYLDDKSFGEVVFTKLKSAQHERPGREVVFWGLQNFLQRNGEGEKNPPHTLHIHQDFLEDSFKYLNCVSSDPTN